MADKKISALTAASTPLAGTEVLPIVQSGSTVKVSVANLTAGRTQTSNGIVQGTAATGYNFTANTPAAGMTSQLLNWYEEGTFTPVIADASTGGNAGTAEFTFARYTRIGRKIFFNINLVNVNTSGLTAGNTLFLRGLPFTAGNWCNGFSNTAAVTNFTYAGTMINAEVYAGGTYIRFYDVKSATGATLLTVAAISSGSCNIYINGMYEV